MKSKQAMGRTRALFSFLTEPLHLLAGLFVAAFLFGGSARADSLGHLIVAPVALTMLLIGTWRFSNALKTYRAVGFFLIATCAVILMQLFPLPPSLWYSLPGHGQFGELARLTGTQELWRPINLTPHLGWVSLSALLVPAAVFALACGMATTAADNAQRNDPSQPTRGQAQQPGFERMLMLVVLIGMVSAVISVAQLLGPPNGPLFFHRITNAGSAVGFFANRNHQAAFLACLFPLLAVLASLPSANARNLTARRAVLVAAAGLIVALILVGGSRAGIVLAMIGLGWAFFIYRPTQVRKIRGEEKRLRHLGVALGIALVLGLALLAVILSRAQSIERAMGGADNDLILRTDIWSATWRQALEFFPTGTGLGAFVESYRMVEPLEQITPYYVNHAHNDWLEVLHGGGVLGAVLLIALTAWWAMRVIDLLRTKARESAAGRLALAGGAIVSILGVASLVDYPLRTAPLAALFMLALLWLSGNAGNRRLAGS